MAELHGSLCPSIWMNFEPYKVKEVIHSMTIQYHLLLDWAHTFLLKCFNIVEP